jgi:hypothetical protein
MLASWSGGDSKSVKIYDGIKWGFRQRRDMNPGGSSRLLATVPEPSGFVPLVATGLGMALRARRFKA